MADLFIENVNSAYESEDVGAEEKQGVNNRRNLKIAVFTLVLASFIYSVAIWLYSSDNRYFAEFYSAKVSSVLREGLATVSGMLPFSLTEFAVVSGVIAFVFMFARAVILKFVYKEKGRLLNFLYAVICIVLVLGTVFINTFGVCYKRLTVSELLGMEETEITQEDVLISTYLSAKAASGFFGKFSVLPEGSTVMPYGFDELTEKIMNGYSKFLVDVPENVSVKQVALSEPWSYTHITGMYFPFTGESNINTNYPDFAIAFTTAHEIAHQLGYAREDEANFLAFLACSFSGDEYLAYTAYLHSMWYLIPELNGENAELIYSTADSRCFKEIRAYFDHADKYTNKTVSAVSTAVNDTYLKANGVKNGSLSYDEVTLYICRYFKIVFHEYFNEV